MLKKYQKPLLNHINPFLSENEGKLSYYSLWRALKTMSTYTFILDAKEVENAIVKVRYQS